MRREPAPLSETAAVPGQLRCRPVLKLVLHSWRLRSASVGVLSAITLLLACGKEPTRLRALDLPNGGRLELRGPESWNIKAETRDLVLQAPKFEARLTAMPLSQTDDSQSLARTLTAVAARTVAGKESIEDSLPLTELKGPHLGAFYFGFTPTTTDGAVHITRGLAECGGRGFFFTLVSHDRGARGTLTTLAALQQASCPR